MLNHFYFKTQRASQLHQDYYKNLPLSAFLVLVSFVIDSFLIVLSLLILSFGLFQVGHAGLHFLSSTLPHFISLIGPAIVLALARAVTAS